MIRRIVSVSLVLVLFVNGEASGQPQKAKESAFTALTLKKKTGNNSVAYVAIFSGEPKGAAKTAALAAIKGLNPPGAKVTVTEAADGNTVKENELGIFFEYETAPNKPFLKSIARSGDSTTVTYDAPIKPGEWKKVLSKVAAFATGKKKGKTIFSGLEPKKSSASQAFKTAKE